MRAATIDSQRIVTNLIAVERLEDYEGAVACPDWVLVGMSIDEPMPIFIASAEQNKQEAQKRLAATDWVNQPDVYDPSSTPHLTNRDAFLSYRAQVRGVAVNPVDGNLDWPQQPTAVWV
jgi:transglutaminase-like putative cysteine protease